MHPIHLVVMGVSGCGKSTLAGALARSLGLPLIEGDDFHPPANRAKMAEGTPLTDADRDGWLAALGTQLQAAPAGAVMSCSALKRAYRERLRAACPGLRFAFLHLSREAAVQRVAARAAEHFFPDHLVASQFATLEPPVGEPGVLALDATRPLAELVDEVGRWVPTGAAA